MTFVHATVWIDHRSARVLRATEPHSAVELVEDMRSRHQIHQKSRTQGAGKVGADPAFLAQVADLVEACEELLIVGPGLAKREFQTYLGEHRPALAAKVVGVEALDHPTDGELIAFARQYFVRVDRLLGRP